MAFCVYILESEADGKWYYGFSENPEQRISDHLTNRSGYTRFKGPWKLIFMRDFSDKTEALRFEKYLKTSRDKKFVRLKFGEYFIDSPRS